MRKLSVLCAAAMLAMPIAAETAFAQKQPVGRADNVESGLASSAAAGAVTTSPGALTRLPTASAAAIQGVEFPSTTSGSSGAAPTAYGTAGQLPFTTSRVESYNNSFVAASSADPVTDFPFRAVGKLWSRYCLNSSNQPSPLPCLTAEGEHYGYFVCTASLIKPGVLVTAAHCVHFYGRQNTGYADYVYWEPAKYATSGAGAAPYGIYRARFWTVPFEYWNGTDTCAQVGVICNNDIALVVLWNNNGNIADNAEAQPGDLLGYFGYGPNGYSFVTSSWLGNRLAAQISQLGYPEGLDSGDKQIRTDAAAIYVNWIPTNTKNIIWGSAQTGGSSGGPEIVNLGYPPVYGGVSEPQSPGTSNGQVIVGVTSWKYNDINQRILAASWFGINPQYPGSYAPYGSGNIPFLVRFICTHATYGSQCT